MLLATLNSNFDLGRNDLLRGLFLHILLFLVPSFNGRPGWCNNKWFELTRRALNAKQLNVKKKLVQTIIPTIFQFQKSKSIFFQLQ